MRIAFSPALGETIHVSVTRTGKSTTELHFTATLSAAADYEQIASGRVKLQAWSDIPASGRSSGDWGDAEFKPVLQNEHGFSLLSVHEQNQIRTSLILDFTVPTSGHRFSFTYRLVYPTGEIKWLGAYGHNGTLVLSRTHSEPVILGQGWVADSVEHHSHHRDSEGSAVQDLEVARLAHHEDYTAWSPLAENSFLYPKDSSLVVLVPRLSSRPVVLPPTLVFGATPSGSITFSSHGAITTTGTGSLFFTACRAAAEVEASVSRVINLCSSPRFRVVSYTQGAVVLASAADKYPAEVAIIPIASSGLLIQSTLLLRDLASLISGGAQFCVFSSLRKHTQVFSRGIVEASDESLTLTVGRSGGHFVVSPLERVDHGEEQWHVGIVSPFTPIPVSADGLPTPPPSPRLRPLTHRVSEPAFQSPDPSFLSLPAPISSDDRSGNSLVVHSASNRRVGVLAAIRHLFIILFVWFGSWFARIFRTRRPEVQSRRITDERTPLLQEPNVASTPTQEDVNLVLPDMQTPAANPSHISAYVGGGNTTLIFQGSSPTLTVPIHLDGRAVNLNVQRTDDGLFVAEFSSTTGGRLKMGW
ncbi:hypothetical protein DFH07DRAFT_254664 [Mycena maculata]|uniref:Uncharacterized protein n=1 Tax=Mycena maculata TaxID=230809 RepID=A0AAD7JUI2_9AGAR|nr:hypothetical protein DFH07DRAFT_254664 [Mycena maculata]